MVVNGLSWVLYVNSCFFIKGVFIFCFLVCDWVILDVIVFGGWYEG